MSDKKPPPSRKGKLKRGDDDDNDDAEAEKSSASSTSTDDGMLLSNIPHPGKNGKSQKAGDSSFCFRLELVCLSPVPSLFCVISGFPPHKSVGVSLSIYFAFLFFGTPQM